MLTASTVYLAAQMCCWTAVNFAVIYFIPQPLAGCEHSLIPIQASFSRSLSAPSNEHLIRSMKWGSRLLKQRFNTSQKIRLILINYPIPLLMGGPILMGQPVFVTRTSQNLSFLLILPNGLHGLPSLKKNLYLYIFRTLITFHWQQLLVTQWLSK